MSDHSDLEQRLRDAAAPAVWDDVSPDAWQQNERRLAADRSRRGGRRLRVVAAAAAAVVVIGGGTLLASQFNGSSLAPSSGGAAGSDPFGKQGRVGHTVVLERFKQRGATVVHSAFLTRSGGKGVSLCDSYDTPSPDPNQSNSSGSGSCTATSPDSANPKTNAFAYVTGSESADLKGVTGAVEPRVASLKAWVADSAEPRTVPLHTLGFEGLQAFAVTTLGRRAPVVRIVAYDAGGALLQVLGPPAILGAQWLPDDDTCAHTTPVPRSGDTSGLGPVETTAIASSSIRISGTAGPSNICVAAPKGQAITSGRQGQYVVVVTGPEVSLLGFTVAGKPAQITNPQHFAGSPWGLVMIFTEHPKAQVLLSASSANGTKLGPAQYYMPPT
jgi:hypothetical protein